MILITPENRDQYRQIHDAGPYGATGKRWATEAHRALCGCETVLDYGCGTGSLGKLLEAHGFSVWFYDPAVRGWDDVPTDPVDGIVCTDVLEHVEPECLDAVLEHMRSLMRYKGFLVISTKPARKHLPDGRNAHAIVQNGWWWGEKLSDYFTVKFRTDLSRRGEFVCEVKP